MEKILVTGGAGFIGSHLVDALVQKGMKVVILDNLFRGQLGFIEQHIKSGKIQSIKGDVRNVEVLRDVMEGVSLVYHLAAQSNVIGSYSDINYSFSTNVGGTFNVLRVAAERTVKRMVFSSSREVYGEPAQLPVFEDAPINPKNAYGASKAAGEIYCNEFIRRGMDVKILRLANVYGVRDTDRVIPLFVKNALLKEPLTIYGGDQLIDFIHIDHVIHALLAAGFGDWPVNTAVNVGCGVGISLTDLADKITKSIDKNVPINIVPSRDEEVRRFIAATDKLDSIIANYPAKDPLDRLPEVIDYWKKQLLTDLPA